MEGVIHKRGGNAFELKGSELLVLICRLGEVHQKRRSQRSVDDKTGIPFVLRRVVMIIVDAMAVEGDSGITKHQGGVRDDCVGRCRDTFGCGTSGLEG